MGFWDRLNAALGPKVAPDLTEFRGLTEIRIEDKKEIPPTHLVGESHYQPALSRVSGRNGDEDIRYPCRATIRLETENRAHPEALVVEIDGHRVGYISHDDATWWRPVIKEAQATGIKFSFVAKVVARGPDKDRETVNAGVMVWLPGPDELRRRLANRRQDEPDGRDPGDKPCEEET